MARIFLSIAVWMLCTCGPAAASPPRLYHQAAHQSPVQALPDDLLLVAGYGLAVDDVVVYQAIRDTTKPLSVPSGVPNRSNADTGIAPIVSSGDVPYSLTVKWPSVTRANQSYALWVRTSHGEWSMPLRVNDARPLWFSPAYVYASAMPAGLPRELKVVGRNLRPASGHTEIRLSGPTNYSAPAARQSTGTLTNYVATIPLPKTLPPGRYRVEVTRDGVSRVAIDAQRLEVLPDPPSVAEFAIDDVRFGGCRPDDGIDDTDCIARAVAAAAATGGGVVHFSAGTWDLIDPNHNGVSGDKGILVPDGVQLRGSGVGTTRLVRHPEWNAKSAMPGLTLAGHTVITGFTFRDTQIYQVNDDVGPFLQLGEDWQSIAARLRGASDASVVSDVVVSNNRFERIHVAIRSGGLPLRRLFVTYNEFGAFSEALSLNGDQFDVNQSFRIDDAVIDYNVFKPGSKLDLIRKTGTIVSELGAGLRVDFSGNTADGASSDFLYSSDDAKGWRAAYFWNPNGNVENTLISHNTATCTGDKIGDGEAIALDNNTNTFAFAVSADIITATERTVTMSAPLLSRQHERTIPIATYYIGHWVQVVNGPGLGQTRKIAGYSTDPATRLTTFTVSPDFDVIPQARVSRAVVGREYWQVFILDNHIDNRKPLCQKSNRSRPVAGVINIWGPSVDSVIAGNEQFDSEGIFVQQNYVTAEHLCPDCPMSGYFNYFLAIHDNLVDGEYDWSNDCSNSGIALGVAASPWDHGLPPTVSFGVAIAHNTVRHADGSQAGAIGQISSWFPGPAPGRWPLANNLIIQHNAISDIEGPRAAVRCGKSRPRVGISFPDSAVAWHTVLYSNSCKHVSVPVGPGGIDPTKVCPSSALDSCECP